MQRHGFRIDHDDYSDEDLARDPFYQEFLRPAGLFWHANAVLSANDGSDIELSFKRAPEKGPYSYQDVEALDAILPELRGASRIMRHTLDAESRGMARLLKARGLLTIELDRRGRVLVAHEQPGVPALPLDIVNRRLVAIDRTCQGSLDRALADVENGHLALAALNDQNGRRYILQVHPLADRARDLFLSASAVAVLIERDRTPCYSRPSVRTIASLFGLTEREAEVACLRAEGLEFPAIAAMLGISPGTARTYIKFAYDKIGVSRQAELVALITRLLN